uniref:Acetylglutamate kinase n=1 Tax=Hommersandiophycus borowitzkae TaxID=268573 RepID=A0A1G4NUQ2_9FLOR|nr:Acetylglutamate kinase [Hommersandiophycus borowitzkae]SCW22239.1 Acetylglutamate kinase [Hommersandiophycus borowitzkae]
MDYSDKIASVIGELGYKSIVVKYGGAAMKDEKLTNHMVQNLILLHKLGLKCIVVHGGGPNINIWLQKLDIKPIFKEGIRITDPITMEIVRMVLIGQVNKDLVALLNKYHANAVGLSGHDSNLIVAEPVDHQSDNCVGNVHSINTEILKLFIDNHYLPVIAPIGVSTEGRSYNINADLVAGAIAKYIEADALIMLTDTPGILEDSNDKSTLLDNLTTSEVCNLIDTGVIYGGMLPKVRSCLNALNNGVSVAKIIDGRIANSLIWSLTNDNSIGTSIHN